MEKEKVLSTRFEDGFGFREMFLTTVLISQYPLRIKIIRNRECDAFPWQDCGFIEWETFDGEWSYHIPSDPALMRDISSSGIVEWCNTHFVYNDEIRSFPYKTPSAIDYWNKVACGTLIEVSGPWSDAYPSKFVAPFIGMDGGMVVLAVAGVTNDRIYDGFPSRFCKVVEFV